MKNKPVKWGFKYWVVAEGDRMNRGNEGPCVGYGAIPGTVLSGVLGTKGQDRHRD